MRKGEGLIDIGSMDWKALGEQVILLAWYDANDEIPEKVKRMVGKGKRVFLSYLETEKLNRVEQARKFLCGYTKTDRYWLLFWCRCVGKEDASRIMSNARSKFMKDGRVVL